MNAIMHDKVRIAEAVNAKIISLDDAPLGYQNFDQGESVKCAAPAHRARTRLRFPPFCLSVCRLFAQVRDGPSRRNGQGSGARVTRLYQTYLARGRDVDVGGARCREPAGAGRCRCRW